MKLLERKKMKKYLLFIIRPYGNCIVKLENGILKDVIYHQDKQPSLVGALFKGKVSRILDKLPFSFVEMGLNKQGFLYEKTDHKNKKENIKKGDEILIQVRSDSFRSKGIRVNREISLPNRYLVYMPKETKEKRISISRKIQNQEERDRIKNILDHLDFTGSLIARTFSQNANEEDLKKDAEKLFSEWEKLKSEYEKKKAPSLIRKGFDPNIDYLKNFLDEEVDIVWVDEEKIFKQLKDFSNYHMPNLNSRIKLYSSKPSLLEKFKLEKDLKDIEKDKVYFKNGGFLHIEELEAFVVIDVNTGRYMGKHKNEDVFFTINQIAAKEIARQIQIRSLSGIILIDFVDMQEEKQREEVVSILKSEMHWDKSYPKIFPMGDLGLVQITRKRTRSSLSEQKYKKCESCKGSGRQKKLSVLSTEIFFELEKLISHSRFFFKKKLYPEVLCHPNVKEWIEENEKNSLDFLEKKFSIYPRFSSFSEESIENI